MLAHLAYVSNRKSQCTDQEIEKILSACKKNNPPLEITGVLLYSNHQFIQYVEGESSKISALYDKIKQDSRHEKTVMLSYGPIQHKLFPAWHMGSKKVNDKEVVFDTQISPEERETFRNILSGNEAESKKIQNLLVKFFKR